MIITEYNSIRSDSDLYNKKKGNKKLKKISGIKITIYILLVILNLIYLIFGIISVWYLVFIIGIHMLKGEKIIRFILTLIVYIATIYGIQCLFNKIIKFVEIDNEELKKYFKTKFDILEDSIFKIFKIKDE